GAERLAARVPPEVREAYLRGRHLWIMRNRSALERAKSEFESAVALAPRFALGYAGLADVYLSFGDLDYMPAREANRRRIEMALGRLALDDSLAEPHISLGHGLLHMWSFGAAEVSLQKAVRINPSQPIAHYYLAFVLAVTGRHEESIRE